MKVQFKSELFQETPSYAKELKIIFVPTGKEEDLSKESVKKVFGEIYKGTVRFITICELPQTLKKGEKKQEKLNKLRRALILNEKIKDFI